MLSEKSVEIKNGDFQEQKDKITDYEKDIIKNCSKLIFDESNENILKGVFNGIWVHNGIKIKLTHEPQNDIYYISFDLEEKYYTEFFNQYLKECDSNVKIPCHFIIQKLPTILIFNLLEKSSVIFTGKRMGGVIASSLAFYMMYIGKSMNKKFGNAFLKEKKNSIGVVTFGSPSFLSNLTDAEKMKNFTSYFYHIKEDFDYIPEIIDYINHDNFCKNACKTLTQNLLEKIFYIFNKIDFENNEINLLNQYLTSINFIESNIKLYINKYINIPFGYYYLMKSTDYSLISITEDNFEKFYYYKKFNSRHTISHLKIYKNLASNINFNKHALKYLENKNNELEIIQIIRRNYISESDTDNSKIKAVIKFELDKSKDNIISPDIIQKISLFPNKNKPETEIIINNENIYYDNDKDITAYIDNINENMNINAVTITNYFSGEIKVKYILNIQGSGPTRKMLFDNLEKLFLIPYFKLFEIFYISFGDKSKYINLKEENFGKDFEEIKILEPFQKQLKCLNELLLFTRPDILSKKEDIFEKVYIDNFIETDLKDLKLDEDLKKNIKQFLANNLQKYHEESEKLQNGESFCTKDTPSDSINQKSQKDNKKIFMCKFDNISNDILSQKFDDSHIKKFFIEKYIIEVLKEVEKKLNSVFFEKQEDFKRYLNSSIGKEYNSLVIPNVLFFRMLILTSIEGGDFIKFNHNINWMRFLYHLKLTNPKVILNLFPKLRYDFYEKDFEKIYSKDKIEEINMKNIFYKTKVKKVIKSNINDELSDKIDSNTNIGTDIYNYINKIKNFSKYSENTENCGKEYYESFLQLLNNYSNDFPEDIEISIYNNLKQENNFRVNNMSAIIDMINDYINDDESKKGFLALLRQSYLLGELRTNVVSNIKLILFSFIYRKENILSVYLGKKSR